MEQILFVEKELGRCFCTEGCIVEYFQPTIDAMVEEWQKLRAKRDDFSDEQNAGMKHYQGLTLEDPDEVWVQSNTENGEKLFTFISQFNNKSEKFHYIVVCFTIEGVPSFVFLSFATRDENLIEHYRRGKELKIEHRSSGQNPEEIKHKVIELAERREKQVKDPLAEDQDMSANLMAFYHQVRDQSDIPEAEHHRFKDFIDHCLEDPDEIWKFTDSSQRDWYCFMTRFVLKDPNESNESNDSGDDHAAESDAIAENQFSMIVVCAAENNGLKVVFSAPTIDPGLIQHFRRGVNSLNKAFGVGWTRGSAA